MICIRIRSAREITWLSIGLVSAVTQQLHSSYCFEFMPESKPKEIVANIAMTIQIISISVDRITSQDAISRRRDAAPIGRSVAPLREV